MLPSLELARLVEKAYPEESMSFLLMFAEPRKSLALSIQRARHLRHGPVSSPAVFKYMQKDC